MVHRLGLAVLAVGLGAALSPGVVQAQETSSKASFGQDAALTKRGKTLWQNRGCAGCHYIGKGQLAGPDLADVLDRREVEWVVKWLLNTNEMLDSDPIGQEMLKQYKNVRMPDLKLKEAEVEALLHFIAAESQKAAMKRKAS